MFNGTHLIIYSQDPVADRAFFADVLDFKNIDAGDGWLIFALPTCELGIHPHQSSAGHEIYFLCDDINETKAKLNAAGVECEDPVDQGYGIESYFNLPGGSRVGFYQPRHAQP